MPDLQLWRVCRLPRINSRPRAIRRKGYAALAPQKSSSFGIFGDALLELGDYDEAAGAFEKLARQNRAALTARPGWRGSRSCAVI